MTCCPTAACVSVERLNMNASMSRRCCWPAVPEAKLKTPRFRKLTSVSKPPSWLKPKPRLFTWLDLRKPVFSCMFWSCGIFMLCGSCSRLALMITFRPPVGSWWQMLQLVAAPSTCSVL